MAKDRETAPSPSAPPVVEPTVSVPASLLHELQARLHQLENAERLRQEAAARPSRVLDQAWEAEKASIARTAKERTQEIADQKYGTRAPRFAVSLDPHDDDGKVVKIAEHFSLDVSAASDLEAQARYLDLMGIKRHEYKLVVKPLAA